MLRDNIKHKVFSFQNIFANEEYGVKFIYAHYWNKDKPPTDSQFKSTQKIFENLLNHGWEFIHIKDLKNFETWPKQQKKIFLSFDDGFNDIFYLWDEIATNLGIKYTVFINPGFIEDFSNNNSLVKYFERFNNFHTPASWNHIVKILKKDYCDIQSHGFSHKRLSNLKHQEFRQEVLRAEDTLKKRIGIEAIAYAWAYGTYSDITISQIEYLANKYTYVFSAYRSKLIFNRMPNVINRDHFELNWPELSIKYLLNRKRIY